MASQQNLEEVIAISGISGRFPESDTIEEFKTNLFNGVNVITEDDRRWVAGIHGIPKGTGKIKDISRFDADFFKLHKLQVEGMDPQMRLLIEVTYEAIIDAGINPNELRGSKTGVFAGVSTSDSAEFTNLEDVESFNGHSLLGHARALIPNRVSYVFDLKGPSTIIDTACSSSLMGIHQAVTAIRNGQCNAAIVAGCSLLQCPRKSVHMDRLGVLSRDAKCKTFDSSADGYVRSEAIGAVFLQKVSDAKRLYCTVESIKANCDGYKKNGIVFPDGQSQKRLIQEAFANIGINPLDVVYVEAHGTGTAVGDGQEANAIADFFCKNRKEPLLIGSVKSNMGHSEAASAMCSLAKIIIAMENGKIPANLHYKSPNAKIAALKDGRMKVVAKNEDLKGDLIAVNSFGIGGANVHAVLKANPKKKHLEIVDSTIPRVVGVSGRSEEAIRILLQNVYENRNDAEFLGLINEIHKNNIEGHDLRGFSVLNKTPIVEISKVVDTKRPLWFVYSGMGSQWAQMGKNLMEIEVFRNSIAKSSKALKPHGFGLEWLLLNSTESTFDNLLNSFVTITAMQIALTDVLKSLGLEPDGFVGHSMGELGCAYADGSLTTEQAVLASYFRGRAVFDTKLEPGSMAVVGLSWEKVKLKCPPGIELACHNSPDNITISGPQQTILKFIKDLTAENIFARKVECGNFGFHSKYIAAAGPKLQEALNILIPNPKPRTNRWISSSIPESSWDSSLAATSSGEYFVNNFLSPVLFHDALQHVPKNAIVVEIAPTGLMQRILKRTLDQNCTNINLMNRNNENNLEFFLISLGKIYNAGAQPQFGNLYPPIEFPVSKGTPMINSLIKWEHSQQWHVPDYSIVSKISEQSIKIDMQNESNQYLLGHVIDGKVLFPGAGYLVLAWQMFAKLQNKSNFDQLPVIFENVKLHRATFLTPESCIDFAINIFKNTGDFQLSESDELVMTGKITIAEDVDLIDFSNFKNNSDKDSLPLATNDIYKELSLRGYEYKDNFCGIFESDNQSLNGKLKWNNNWTTFLDTMLQFFVLGINTRELFFPTDFQKIIIDPEQHLKYIDNNSNINISVNHNINIIQSGCIEIHGLKGFPGKRQFNQNQPILTKYKFVPNENSYKNKDEDEARILALTVLTETVLENNLDGRKLHFAEIGNKQHLLSTLLIQDIKKILQNLPLQMVDGIVFTNNPEDGSKLEKLKTKHAVWDLEKAPLEDQKKNLIIIGDALSKNNITIIKNGVASLENGGFLLLEEPENIKNKIDQLLKFIELEIISVQSTSKKIYILLRKSVTDLSKKATIIKITETNFNWVEDLKEAMKKTESNNIEKIYLYAHGEELNGLIGMINCLRQEPGGAAIRSVFIEDKNEPEFNLKTYEKQLRKDLVHNILRKKVWGAYRQFFFENNNSKIEVEHAYVNTLHSGDLSSLDWIESPLTFYKPGDLNLELCYVYYCSLNTRDILLATGKFNPSKKHEYALGIEFSGRDSKGRRIMGLVPNGKCLATTVLTNPEFLWEVPEKWSLEEAATIPLFYATSFYALIERGRLQKDETVLIHSGTDGLSLAAIFIALHMGCKVFTTVDNEMKRNYLKKTFPELTDNNIGNYQDCSFEQLIMKETNGKGVNVILNLLNKNFLQASVRCLAPGGRFLEINDSNSSISNIDYFKNNTTYHNICLENALENKTILKNIFNLINDGIRSNCIQPLPVTVFDDDELELAFRELSNGQEIGKILIQMRDEEKRKTLIPKPYRISAIPRIYPDPIKTYILVGGLGGFGLELANWMINRGATKIILTSRNGVKTGYQSLCIRRWKELGVNIKVSITDCSTPEKTQCLLQEANSLGPIGGIFNLAVVLRDALIEKQTITDFEIACKPKITATKHLDTISRSLAPQLDYFICFSSISSGFGNASQANYGLANSAMERICEARQADGLPGLAIQWGAIGDVGIYAETFGNVIVNGIMPQSINSCLNTMDILMQQPSAIVSSYVIANQKNKTYNMENVSLSLFDAVVNIMGIKNVEEVPHTILLTNLGMDSLIGAEIKQTLERDYNVSLNLQEMRFLTLEKVMQLSNGLEITIEETNNNKNEQKQEETVELIPSKCLIQMPSKSSDNSKNPIFVIHPIEGVVTPLNAITSQINAPIYGLQSSMDVPISSIEETSKYYISQIKKIQPKGPYSLIGYSFGALVAFEMGLQLEQNGEIVNLFCIDGSPDYVRDISVNARITNSKKFDLEGQQCKILIYFLNNFINVDVRKIEDELMELKTLTQRVTYIGDMLMGVVHYPQEEIAQAATVFYQKMFAAYNYKPGGVFKGEITLARAMDSFANDADYGLSEICESDVELVMIEGNHKSIVTGQSAEKIAKVLNNTLLM